VDIHRTGNRLAGASSGHFRRSNAKNVVRAEGLEPSRALRPNGFSYQLRLSPPSLPSTRRHPARFVVWTIPSPWPSAVGAARLVSTPSRSECSVRAWLGIAMLQGSPNLSSSASPVSRRALKFQLSPMRLPISPRPRGPLNSIANCARVKTCMCSGSVRRTLGTLNQRRFSALPTGAVGRL
jgi:hypothetical protein